MKKALWIIFIISAIGVGLYPFIYFIIDPQFGLLGSKSNELLTNKIWSFAFYTHITLGGIALFIGWIQFSKKIRQKYLDWHRRIGKAYVLTVLISGVCGLGIAFYATGGIMAKTGFILLAIIWLSTTLSAFFYAKNKNILAHQKMMIYSYATCFAAVTLRIWLPLLMIYFEGEFIPAYTIVAWLCWIPNLVVAYFIVRKLDRKVVLDT